MEFGDDPDAVEMLGTIPSEELQWSVKFSQDTRASLLINGRLFEGPLVTSIGTDVTIPNDSCETTETRTSVKRILFRQVIKGG